MAKYTIRLHYHEVYELQVDEPDVYQAVDAALASEWDSTPTIDGWIEKVEFNRCNESGTENFREYDEYIEYDEDD